MCRAPVVGNGDYRRSRRGNDDVIEENSIIVVVHIRFTVGKVFQTDIDPGGQHLSINDSAGELSGIAVIYTITATRGSVLKVWPRVWL